jgi:hypothetical protein
MNVGLLTNEQKDLLVNQYYIIDCKFNPIQDANQNWIISIEEINQCINEEFIWIKNLTLIEFEPKLIDLQNV